MPSIDNLHLLKTLDMTQAIDKDKFKLKLEKYQGKLNSLTRDPKFKYLSEPTDGRTTTVRSQTARAIAPRQSTGRLVGDLNANQVAAHYTSWCQRMKLPCVPPRNLRHTFGTLAIAAGADISVVARQLGHSDIKTTARYYLRPDLSVLRSLQRAWERLIIGAA